MRIVLIVIIIIVVHVYVKAKSEEEALSSTLIHTFQCSSPFRASQRIAVASPETVTTCEPPLMIAASLIHASCPFKIHWHWPESMSQTLEVRSSEHVTAYVPPTSTVT